MSKVHANRGITRNKKPLRNVVYKIDLVVPKVIVPGVEQYFFKGLGCLLLKWKYQQDVIFKIDGFISPLKLKQLLGETQYSKFCQGKREFISQRRINGKNI